MVSEPPVARGMKLRRHSNNSGLRQIKRGKTRDQVKAIAKRLGVRYKTKTIDQEYWT